MTDAGTKGRKKFGYADDLNLVETGATALSLT